MVVNLIMRSLPTKIVGQSDRPAQVRDVRAGRLIWHGTIGSWEEITAWDCWVLRSDGRARELTVTRPSSVSEPGRPGPQ